MRSIKLSTPFKLLTQLLSSISVRTRIIVLALIPVVGFLANWLTYLFLFSGERDIGIAFKPEDLEAEVPQFFTTVQTA